MNTLKGGRSRATLASVFSLMLAAACARAEVSVQIGLNFLGSSYETNSQSLPADANGAIGPNHFMEFINGTVAIYNKTNGLVVQRKSNLKFWSDAGLIISPDYDVTDPRVIYDPTVQRWFASQVDFDSTAAQSGQDPSLEANDFLLAVSAGADPTGPWRGFMFQSDPDTGRFADFPTLGVDANAVYLSGDMVYGEENPIGPSLMSVPKADLLSSSPTITNRTWFGVMNYSERGQVLQPVICFDGSCTGAVLSMGDIGTDGEPHSNLVMFAVENAASPDATLTTATDLEVSPYLVPYDVNMGFPVFTALQPDGTSTLQANDARLSAKVYGVRGVLYATHNTELNGRIAIRWYRISAATGTVLESGTIADPNLDLTFPSIAANSNGVVVIAYNASGTSAYLSSFARVGATVNGTTTFGSPILLKAGVVNYHDLNEILGQYLDEIVYSRWGDYSAVSVDPSDASRFWIISMYPSDLGSSGFDEGIWSTQITELLTGPPIPQLTIAATGATAVVSWPLPATSYLLQTTSDLAASSSWSLVAQAPSTNNNRVSVSVPIAANRMFFRLIQGP